MGFTRKVTYKGIDYSVKLIDKDKMIIKTMDYPIVIRGYYSSEWSIIEQVHNAIDEEKVEKTIKRIDEFLS